MDIELLSLQYLCGFFTESSDSKMAFVGKLNDAILHI